VVGCEQNGDQAAPHQSRRQVVEQGGHRRSRVAPSGRRVGGRDGPAVVHGEVVQQIRDERLLAAGSTAA